MVQQFVENVSSGARSLFFKQISSALFYGFSSFMITVVNKTVLTSYKFPSFQVLGIGQMIATIIVLYTSKKLKFIDFPSLERGTFKKTWPLPLIYIGNMLFGLGGTKELSLPMFTALRTFTIWMTMIGESYILKIRPNFGVQFSVYTMIVGDLIAASNDLAFNLTGYVFVLFNNFFTAMNGVFMKRKLDSKYLGKYGLMFYNSLFVILPAVLFAWKIGDIDAVCKFDSWGNYFFLFQFFLSCIMGFILNYSVLMCTYYNSALTTTIVGCLKNICVTYLGMFIGGDYIFSWVNFIGLNLSVLGSLIYTYLIFQKKPSIKSSSELPKSKQMNVV